jgi:uncharacterized membrane protein YhaH (DUF805 family)
MFKVLLADVRRGCLSRLPYLGYSLLIMALMLGFGIAIAVAAGVGEQLVGGDLQQAQDKLREWFTLPAILLIVLVMSLLLFMSANIMAKRVRDIGLPGWWTVAALIVLSAMVTYWISDEAGNGLHTIVWIAMLLVPGSAVSSAAPDTV